MSSTKCSYSGGADIWLGYIITKHEAEKRAPAYIICPICKRKFKPRVFECHDPGCWHTDVPKGHKIKKWWKKNKRG
jgi:hypothetical protein